MQAGVAVKHGRQAEVVAAGVAGIRDAGPSEPACQLVHVRD